MSSKSEKSRPDVILDAILNEDSTVVLLHDENEEAYVAPDGDGRNVYRLSSKAAKRWINKIGREITGKSLTSTMVNQIEQALESEAIFEGKKYHLAVRSVFEDDIVRYDLGSGIIEITAKGWQYNDKPPIIFKRFSHQKSQVMPKQGGDVRTFLKYVNIVDEDEQLLFLVYVISAFIEGFPHPILILHGPQGAGKTTPMTAAKDLIDPSVLREGVTAPNTQAEFAQLANHNWFVFFDNLSTMPLWFSDSLARAVTGTSLSKRGLFTDDEDVIYRFKKIIALNGINQVVYKSDLLDRSILLHLERITPEKRMDTRTFWDNFETDKPYILGAVFDVIAKALELYPSVKLSKYPRMADFARWGCAIAEAAGFSNDDFLRAYSKNIKVQTEEAIEANPLAQVVLKFMENQESWQDTPTKTYGKLESLAATMKLKHGNWPANSARLTKELNLLATDLLAKDIKYESKHGKERLITFTKTTDATDGTDGK